MPTESGVPVVGLTGGIGSGKSMAAEYLQQLGICVVDADSCSRTVVEPGTAALERIAEHFGDAVLEQDGSLDRRRLRELVFADATRRRWLENLLHPLIAQQIARSLESAPGPYAVLMSPLLLETGQHSRCDRIVVVDVPEDLQLERAGTRDKVSKEQIRTIMGTQMKRQDRCARADHLISNRGDLQQLKAAVVELDGKLRAEFSDGEAP